MIKFTETIKADGVDHPALSVVFSEHNSQFSLCQENAGVNECVWLTGSQLLELKTLVDRAVSQNMNRDLNSFIPPYAVGDPEKYKPEPEDIFRNN